MRKNIKRHPRAERLLASPFFFQFAIRCLRHEQAWTAAGIQLDERYRLPSFAALDADPSSPPQDWADLRMAWSADGVVFNLRVRGKQRPPWCRGSRLEDSDGLAVWIDTRNAPGIHRANRFCHQFLFLPAGGGPRFTDPLAVQRTIDRAKENAPRAADGALKIRAEKRVDGYLLEAFIPAAALAGFDPDEQAELGFTFAVYDRELGEYTLTVGGEFPYQSDPSLWSTLELVDG
jgi:hypothetical protein